MRIGIFGGEVAGHGGIDEVVASARRAADEGFASYWMPQIFGLDALTSLAVVGREIPGIELGTAVVPTYPRHPMMLAGQALTTQAISGGRLTLGIGL
jgi:5,10-methylenetetrahydromethanopterin reductase